MDFFCLLASLLTFYELSVLIHSKQKKQPAKKRTKPTARGSTQSQDQAPPAPSVEPSAPLQVTPDHGGRSKSRKDDVSNLSALKIACSSNSAYLELRCYSRALLLRQTLDRPHRYGQGEGWEDVCTMQSADEKRTNGTFSPPFSRSKALSNSTSTLSISLLKSSSRRSSRPIDRS